MNNNSDFEKIGKKMPYYVPAGFFNSITEKTLVEAKQREKALQRKHVFIWRSIATAASLTVLLVFGFQLIHFLTPGKTEQTAQNMSAGPQIEVKHDDYSESVNQIADKTDFDNIKTEADTINKSMEGEGINDLLKSLTNEELIELAAVFDTDMFLEETENILQ